MSTTRTLVSATGNNAKIVGDQLQTQGELDASNPPTVVVRQTLDDGYSKNFTFPLNVTPVPWVPVNAMAQSYRDRVVAALAPGAINPRKWGKALDAFYTTAAASTWWAKIDGLIVGQFDRKVSLLDLKRNLALTDVSAVTWVQNVGFAGGGSSASVLNTGFNPSTAGGAFAQNSAHMGVWQMDGGTSAMMGTTNCRIAMQAANPSTLTIRMNAASTVQQFSSGTLSGPPTNDGHLVVSRDGAAVTNLYFDGDKYGNTDTTASVALTNENIIICGNTNANSFPTVGSRVYHWGGSLTAAEVRAFHYALQTLFTLAYGLNFWKAPDASFNGSSQWVNGRRMTLQNAGKPWSFARHGLWERYETRDGEGASFDAGQPKERSETLELAAPFVSSIATSSGTTTNTAVNATNKTITVALNSGFASPRVGEIVTAVITPAGGWSGTPSGNYANDMASAAQQKRYDYEIQSGDTVSTIATAVAALINPDFAATASGAVITVSGAPSTAAGVLKFFSGGGLTFWVSQYFAIAPSPIGVPQVAQFGPIFGQFHNDDLQSGQLISPPFSLNMDGDKFVFYGQSCRYTPVKYSTYERRFFEVPSSINLRDGNLHRIVIKYRNGAGIDTTAAPGYAVPSIYGPTYPSAPSAFNPGTGKGSVTIWIDGQQVYDAQNIATGVLEYRPDYWKRGIYRGSQHPAGDTMTAVYGMVEWDLADLSDRVANPLPVLFTPPLTLT